MSVASIYFALLLTGLSGSLHCIGMCGPLLLSCSNWIGAREGRGADLAWYHAGRLWTYAVLGAIAGSIGRGLRDWLDAIGLHRIGIVLFATLLLGAGIGLAGLHPRLRVDTLPQGYLARKIGASPFVSALRESSGPVARLLLGATMGLLPCGLVYAALIIASTLPTPIHAGLGMAVFGAGTLPALTLLFRLERRWFPGWRLWGTRWAAALLLLAGCATLWRVIPRAEPACHGEAATVSRTSPREHLPSAREPSGRAPEESRPSSSTSPGPGAPRPSAR